MLFEINNHENKAELLFLCQMSSRHFACFLSDRRIDFLIYDRHNIRQTAAVKV
jgi:hypothetical protein